ncbi:disease resistance protein RPS5-like [Magnolia sinica]|uniref:disease resistance protein RPS5-like n=1 Tax=Magnolia sinica TaxID=86752 RepID=UPI0026584C20|nr:disease resistance protein RPS5-like [Magnolia sinica]
MDFISSVIEIVSCLWGPTTPRKCYIINLREDIDSLKNAMGELKSIRNDMKRKVDVAEQQLLKCTDHMQWWLQRVDATEGEVNEMEEAFQQMMRCFGNCHPNCWSAYKLGKRVAKKLTDVADLITKGKDGSLDVVAETPLPNPVIEQPSTSALGMESTLNEALCSLREDKTRVIGIYGMGGVGKTTLLEEINNEYLKRTGDFHVVIWVVVSKELNLRKIQRDIGKWLGLNWPENESNDTWAQDIYSALREKKFLLLLDDIWQRLDLKVVGIPHPSSQNKSKVVFTTRDEKVCSDMEADKKIKIKCLAWKEAWDLFRGKVGEDAMNSHREIPVLAELVAKECDGLPLALITIGRAMASKKTPEEWKHAITALRMSLSDISGVEDELLFRLKFSYDNLCDDVTKSCFLYCSLFPEDYSINKESIIDYWIGEGFLDGWDDDLDEAHNKGYDLIGTLQLACLLESGSDEKTEVKMHDVVRDLALWISSECGKKKNKFLVKAGVGLREAPPVERWMEADRISLMENTIEEITETPSCPNLLTLILQNNKGLAKIANEFFQFMPNLRVLDLSNNQIKEIPPEIGNLVELKYLNLSNTRITNLPEEMGCLVKLKHLDLEQCADLVRIRSEAISRLSRLKVLKMLNSFRYWEVREGSGWFSLTEMEGLKYLSHLEITIKTVSALKRFLDSHKLPKVTRALTVQGCKGMKTSSFSAMGRLRSLKILYCKEMEEIMIGSDVKKEDYHSLSSLEQLILSRLVNLNIIRVGGCIQNLRNIIIRDCNKLKNVTWILQLQNLEEIKIWDSKGLEEVIGTSGVGIPMGEACLRWFKSLALDNLPELISICNLALAFPSLEKLEVHHCPKLKELPPGLQSADNHLKEIRGAKQWWDGLEWEEAGIKSNLLPFFKETRF